MRIAITGNIGSGKSTFSRQLSGHIPNYASLDVDSISHALYQDVSFLEGVQRLFGSTERSEISQMCFADSALRQSLEDLSLPLWQAHLKQALEPTDLIAEFPLLIETAEYAAHFDLIISVVAPDEAREDRIAVRSGWSPSHIQNAFKSQISSFAKAGAADLIVTNSGSLDELEKQALAIAKNIDAFDALDFKGISKPIERTIMRAYCQSHRHYHNLKHLLFIQKALAPHSGQMHNPEAVHLAILFHDIVYDTRLDHYGLNEQQSIHHLWEQIKTFAPESLRIDQKASTDASITLASELIAATKKHAITSDWLLANPNRVSDCALFLDADLSILAADEAALLEYDQGIREEFIQIPIEIYKTERVKALQSFLNRSQIFLSEPFSHLEIKARSNLQKLIEHTQSRL